MSFRLPQTYLPYESSDYDFLKDFNFDADCQFDTCSGLACPSPILTPSESSLSQVSSKKPCRLALPQIPEPADAFDGHFPDLWPTNDHVYKDCFVGNAFAPDLGPDVSSEASTGAQVSLTSSITYQDQYLMHRMPSLHQSAHHPIHPTVHLSPACQTHFQPAPGFDDSHFSTRSYQPDDGETSDLHSLNHPSVPSPPPPPIFGLLRSNPTWCDSPDANIAESESKKVRRQRNTAAARKYRQRRLDRIEELELALRETQTDRDELKVQVARWRGKAETLQAMMAHSGTRR